MYHALVSRSILDAFFVADYWLSVLRWLEQVQNLGKLIRDGFVADLLSLELAHYLFDVFFGRRPFRICGQQFTLAGRAQAVATSMLSLVTLRLAEIGASFGVLDLGGRLARARLCACKASSPLTVSLLVVSRCWLITFPRAATPVTLAWTSWLRATLPTERCEVTPRIVKLIARVL